MKPLLKHPFCTLIYGKHPAVSPCFFSFALRLVDWYFLKYHSLLGHFSSRITP